MCLGAIYYVDPTNGDDSNDGLSPTTAWRTIGHVNNNWWRFQPGDGLLFKRGEVFTDTTLRIKKGGTVSTPMVVGAYGSGEKPVFNSGTKILCRTDNLAYITIQDIKFTNPGTGSAVYFCANNLSNIIISRVDVINSAQNAIFLAAVDTYIIEDCYVKDAANSGIVIYGSDKNPPKAFLGSD